MILSTASLYPMPTWTEGRETLLDDMRLRITQRARMHGQNVDGSELIEIIPIKRDLHGTWRSASEENATHVKVTLEQEVVE